MRVFSFLQLSSALNCYWCDSRQVNCKRNIVTGLSFESCKPGNNFCSVQKETNSSGIVVQFIRGCTTKCPQMVTKWESNTYFKSKYCRYCCNIAGCNNITGDPCDPFAGGTRVRTNEAITFCSVMLTLGFKIIPFF